MGTHTGTQHGQTDLMAALVNVAQRFQFQNICLSTGEREMSVSANEYIRSRWKLLIAVSGISTIFL